MADGDIFIVKFSLLRGAAAVSPNTGPAKIAFPLVGKGVALVFTGDRDTLTVSDPRRPPYDPAGNTTPDTPSTDPAVLSTVPSITVTTGGGGTTYGDVPIATFTMLHPLKGRAPIRSPGSFSPTPYTGSAIPLDSSTVTLYVPVSRSSPVCSTSVLDDSTHHPVKLVPLCVSVSSFP